MATWKEEMIERETKKLDRIATERNKLKDLMRELKPTNRQREYHKALYDFMHTENELRNQRYRVRQLTEAVKTVGTAS